MKNQQQSQNLLLKADRRSTFRHKSLQHASHDFVAWSRKVKNAKHRPKTYNETIFRDKLRIFVSRILLPLSICHRMGPMGIKD